MLARNQGVRTEASPLWVLVAKWPVPANSNIRVWRVTSPTRWTGYTASCQPSFDFIQVPNDALGR